MRRHLQAPGTIARDARSPLSDRADIVIVGNGIAGLTAAVEARLFAPQKRIVIVTEQSHPTINTPALKQFASGKLTQEQLLAYPAGTERAKEIEMINARVEEIQSRGKFIRLSDGREFGYGSLLLATGSKPNGLPASMPGSAFDGVLALHRLRDYLDLRRRLQSREVKEAVVIGGGIHAIENVVTLLHWGIRVHWLIRGVSFLPKVLDRAASDIVLEHSRRAGARVYTETEVVGIVGRVGSVAGVVTNHQQTLACQLVVVCTGTTPQTALAEHCDIPLAQGSGIIVDERLRTGVRDIYAAGDVAALRNPQTDVFQPRSYWHDAVLQGRAAAAEMTGCNELITPAGVVWHATQVGDLSLLTVGDPLHGSEGVATVTDNRRGGYRRLTMLDDRLVGYLALGTTQPDGLAVKRIIEEGHSIRDIEKTLLTGEFDARQYFAQRNSHMAHTMATTGKLAVPDVRIFAKTAVARTTEPLLPSVTGSRRRDTIPLRQGTGRPIPVIASLKSLMSGPSGTGRWVVPAVLPDGLVILSGKRNAGQSRLGLTLGLGVARGEAVLGRFEADQGDVLYLALDESERSLQERIGMLLERRPPPEGFEYATDWPYMDDEGLASLEEWLVSRPGGRLVIINSWARVGAATGRRAANAGDGAEYEVLEGLRSLAHRFNACILVQRDEETAAPGRHYDEYATWCVDGILHLKRARGGQGATLSGTGPAYAHDLQLALSIQDGCWMALEKAPVPTIDMLPKARRVMIDLLHEYGRPMRPKEIALALGKPDGTVRKLLFDMKACELVRETGQGYVACESGVDKQTVNSVSSDKAMKYVQEASALLPE